MTACYNEIDPYAAAWLRNLIAAGHIAPGDVDERRIADVRPDDLRPYTQCHFFAGIGVWSYALRRAGWPDDLPAWTGSCPCQPFSAAGRGEGFADERHLWPVWRNLIDTCGPTVVFGEQVASALSLGAQPPSGTDMRKLQDREALLGVLRELKGVAASRLQGMHASLRAGEEGLYDGGAIGDPSSVSATEPSGRSDGASEEPSRTERHDLRSGPAGDGSALRYWSVLGDGDSIQSRRRSDVGQSVAGSDQPHAGLHDSELQVGSGLRERDGEHVGCGPDLAHRGNDGAEESDDSTELGPASFAGSELEEADFRAWIDLVQDDMEGLGYAFGAVPFPSAGVGAPHIRDRAYFVAHASGDRQHINRRELGEQGSAGERWLQPDDGRLSRQLADARGESGQRIAGGLSRSQGQGDGRSDHGHRSSGATRFLADATLGGRREERPDAGRRDLGDRTEGFPAGSFAGGGNQRPGPTNGFWRDPDWLHCRDGRWRPVEPGTFPLAHGAPARVGRLRAYGNAINAEAAAAFISASLDVLEDRGDFRLMPMSVLTTASHQGGGIFD